MIGRLTGIVLIKQPPSLVLDVNGVGYEVDAPMSTFYALPEVGQKTVLLIHTHVREDAFLLYGFGSEAERRLFRALMKTSGVGAKLALTILSGISVSDFINCVQNNDSAALVRLPGVGNKTAQRLLIEMKDRLEGVDSSNGEHSTAINNTNTRVNNPIEEAVTALIALGYKPPEASRMVRAVKNAELTEDIIRQALQASIKLG